MLLTQFRCFFFSSSFLFILCTFDACLHHSIQISHTGSDFSSLLRVMISETRILCHFILVLFSSTLMKQLTCNVGIIFLIYTYFWLECLVGVFQVTRTDTSCVLYITCSYFITFEQVMLYSAYCIWFVALGYSIFYLYRGMDVKIQGFLVIFSQGIFFQWVNLQSLPFLGWQTQKF